MKMLLILVTLLSISGHHLMTSASWGSHHLTTIWSWCSLWCWVWRSSIAIALWLSGWKFTIHHRWWSLSTWWLHVHVSTLRKWWRSLLLLLIIIKALSSHHSGARWISWLTCITAVHLRLMIIEGRSLRLLHVMTRWCSSLLGAKWSRLMLDKNYSTTSVLEPTQFRDS